MEHDLIKMKNNLINLVLINKEARKARQDFTDQKQKNHNLCVHVWCGDGRLGRVRG
jgi:hypothetical protein